MHVTDRQGRVVAAVLSAISLGWAVSLPLAPSLSGGDRHAAVRTGVLSLPYAAGALVCHQRPDRSFFTGGRQWPVCARCSGLYLSAACGIAAASVLRRRTLRRLSERLEWRSLLLWAAVPTLASWVVERAGWWHPGVLARAWLAVPLGAGIGALVAIVARGTRPTWPKT